MTGNDYETSYETTPQQRDQQERRSSEDDLFVEVNLLPSQPLMQRSPVSDVIDFEALEDPPWRRAGRDDTEEKPSTVKQMIVDIVAYKKKSTTKEHNKEELGKIREKNIHKYIYHVNAEEEHGVGTEEETKECIKAFQSKAKGEEERAPLTEEEIKVQETTNVYRAYKWLEDKVNEECNEDNSLYGLIESSIVKELHEIIMDKLPLDKGNTKAGECSNNLRYTSFRGERYEYQRPKDMEEAMNKLLDQSNSLITWLKDTKGDEERMLNLFKAASWFLFEFLDLHPFSDGNGRLCRLLCSYALSVYTPFPIPIYNVWSESCKQDFVNALYDARKSSDRHPKALTTMIIECSWFAWKKYITELERIEAVTDR